MNVLTSLVSTPDIIVICLLSTVKLVPFDIDVTCNIPSTVEALYEPRDKYINDDDVTRVLATVTVPAVNVALPIFVFEPVDINNFGVVKVTVAPVTLTAVVALAIFKAVVTDWNKFNVVDCESISDVVAPEK